MPCCRSSSSRRQAFHIGRAPARRNGDWARAAHGIARAALAASHRAPIHIYHGGADLDGLYFWRELAALAARSPELRVFGSVLSGDVAAAIGAPRCQVLGESLDRLILNDPLDFAQCRVYLCGNPEVVQRLRQRIYLSGAPRSRIQSDPFVPPAATSF